MNLPLIFDESGDVSVYWSLSDAIRSVEATDIKNNEYVGYDATGRVLLLSAKDSGSVQISLAEETRLHTHELISKLREFIRARQKTIDLNKLSLDELVSLIETNKIRN